jgi:hypothetical protein
MLKKSFFWAFLVFVGLSILVAPAAVAVQYLGETTWTITKTQNERGAVIPQETYTLKGAITLMGGSYYTMQGYVAPSQDGPFIVSGGGVLIDSTLYLTLSASQKHVDTERDTAIMHIELDKVSLNGSFFTVGRDFDTATAGPAPIFGDSFNVGTLTRTGPAINLTPKASMGTTSLLLLKE